MVTWSTSIVSGEETVVQRDPINCSRSHNKLLQNQYRDPLAPKPELLSLSKSLLNFHLLSPESSFIVKYEKRHSHFVIVPNEVHVHTESMILIDGE